MGMHMVSETLVKCGELAELVHREDITKVAVPYSEPWSVLKVHCTALGYRAQLQKLVQQQKHFGLLPCMLAKDFREL